MLGISGMLRKAFGRERPRSSCWVCETPVGTAYPGDCHGSPLGDAFTFGGCRRCQQARAVTPEHAAWFLTLAGGGEREAGMMASVDAGGERSKRPVHVYRDGAYTPLPAWAASGEGVAYLAGFRERRDVAPGEDARQTHGIGILRAA